MSNFYCESKDSGEPPCAGLAALRAEVANYATLKRAVNESTNECSPHCNDYCHAGDCPANNSARWLEDQQREIERLREWGETQQRWAHEWRDRTDASRAEIERLRGLLLRVNDADRHLEDGAYWVRLYYGDFEDIRAALAEQPSAKPYCWHCNNTGKARSAQTGQLIPCVCTSDPTPPATSQE